MNFKALALAAVFAATGSAFAATVTRTTTVDHVRPDGQVVRHVKVVQKHRPAPHRVVVVRRAVVHPHHRHYAVVKPVHHRHYAVVRHDRVHTASTPTVVRHTEIIRRG